VPDLDFGVGDLDVATFHIALIVQALAVLGFQVRKYTILAKKKETMAGLGRFPEAEKSRWTWWPTTSDYTQ
jgi:hypothetical protein